MFEILGIWGQLPTFYGGDQVSEKESLKILV